MSSDDDDDDDDDDDNDDGDDDGDAAADDDDDDEYDNATSNEFLGHLGSSHNSSFLCGNLGFDFQNKGTLW